MIASGEWACDSKTAQKSELRSYPASQWRQKLLYKGLILWNSHILIRNVEVFVWPAENWHQADLWHHGRSVAITEYNFLFKLKF